MTEKSPLVPINPLIDQIIVPQTRREALTRVGRFALGQALNLPGPVDLLFGNRTEIPSTSPVVVPKVADVVSPSAVPANTIVGVEDFDAFSSPHPEELIRPPWLADYEKTMYDLEQGTGSNEQLMDLTRRMIEYKNENNFRAFSSDVASLSKRSSLGQSPFTMQYWFNQETQKPWAVTFAFKPNPALPNFRIQLNIETDRVRVSFYHLLNDIPKDGTYDYWLRKDWLRERLSHYERSTEVDMRGWLEAAKEAVLNGSDSNYADVLSDRANTEGARQFLAQEDQKYLQRHDEERQRVKVKVEAREFASRQTTGTLPQMADTHIANAFRAYDTLRVSGAELLQTPTLNLPNPLEALMEKVDEVADAFSGGAEILQEVTQVAEEGIAAVSSSGSLAEGLLRAGGIIFLTPLIRDSLPQGFGEVFDKIQELIPSIVPVVQVSDIWPEEVSNVEAAQDELSQLPVIVDQNKSYRSEVI